MKKEPCEYVINCNCIIDKVRKLISTDNYYENCGYNISKLSYFYYLSVFTNNKCLNNKSLSCYRCLQT